MTAIHGLQSQELKSALSIKIGDLFRPRNFKWISSNPIDDIAEPRHSPFRLVPRKRILESHRARHGVFQDEVGIDTENQQQLGWFRCGVVHALNAGPNSAGAALVVVYRDIKESTSSARGGGVFQ